MSVGFMIGLGAVLSIYQHYTNGGGRSQGCRLPYYHSGFQLADRNPKMGHGAIFWESREGNNKHFDSFLDKHPVSSLASSQSQVRKHYSFFYS